MSCSATSTRALSFRRRWGGAGRRCDGGWPTNKPLARARRTSRRHSSCSTLRSRPSGGSQTLKIVGDWLLAPNRDLRGGVPAEIAVELPRESVDLFVADMALVAPRERALPTRTKLTPDTLRQAFEKLALPTIASRSEPPEGEADLSDFD